MQGKHKYRIFKYKVVFIRRVDFNKLTLNNINSLLIPVSSQQGFSLISLATSMGIGSLILAATLAVLTILLSAQSHVNMKSDLMGMDTIITTVLRNKNSCSSAFQGNPNRKQTINLVGISPTNPRTHEDITIYYPRSNGDRILARKDHKFGGVKITKLAVKEANLLGKDMDQNNVYFVIIAMEAEKKRSSMTLTLGGQGFRAKEYGMTLITHENTQEILSCNPKPSAAYLADVCTGIGGTINTATGNCTMSIPSIDTDRISQILSRIKLSCTIRNPGHPYNWRDGNHANCMAWEELTSCLAESTGWQKTPYLKVWPVGNNRCAGREDGVRIHAYCCHINTTSL